MPKKITKLTDEQAAQMPAWRDKWIAHGLSTERADWARFERGIKAAYRFAKLDDGIRIVRVSSPLVLAFAAPIADKMILGKIKKGDAVNNAVGVAVSDAVGVAVSDAVSGAVRDAVHVAVRRAVRDAVHVAVNNAISDAVRDAVSGAVRDAVSDAVGVAVSGAVRDAVRDAVGGAVRDAVHVAVRDAVGVAVRGAVRDAVHVAVRDAVGGAVRGAVRDAVHDAVNNAIGGAVRDAVENNWQNYIGGQFWVGGWWGSPSFASFFRDICKLQFDNDIWERAQAYEDMSYAGWCWPHSRFCMVSDRPTILHRDDNGQLHCEDGPAIAWLDGFCIYSIHGVTVPKWVIERPDTITVQTIDAEQNAEVKRIMIDRMGVNRYLQETSAKVLHMDMVRVMEGSDDHMPRALMEDKDGRRFLVGTDGSTERCYYMQTSRTAKNCEEAHMALNGGLKDSLCVMQS